MGLIQKIKDVFGLVEKSATPITRMNWVGPWTYFDLPGMPDIWRADYQQFRAFAWEAFGKNPHVYAVVSRIAQGVAALPRDFFEDFEDQQEPIERVPNEVRRMLDAPSWKNGRAEFFEEVAFQLLITGNAIIAGRRPVGFSKFGELIVLHTKDVIVETDDGSYAGRPVKYQDVYHGIFPAEDVLHIRLPNPLEDSYWGLSPLVAGQTSYGASNNTLAAGANIHNNRGATGVLSPKGAETPLMPKEQEKLQESWDIRSSGVSKFGKVHVAGQEMTYVSIGMSSVDLQLIEHDVQHLRTICSIYGVSSQLFGDTQASTYSNMQEAKEAMYRDTLAPLAAKIDRELSIWLLQGHYRYQSWYRIDKGKIPFLNRPNIELSTKVAGEVAAGILTVDEAREMLYPGIGEIEKETQNQNEND